MTHSPGLEGGLFLPGRNASRIGHAPMRIPNSYPGGFHPAAVRQIRPPIPLSAGAAFRRWGPSSWRRISAQLSLGHSPPGPALPRPAGLEQSASGSGKLGACRYEAGLTEPPERDEQLAGERDNHYPSDPALGSSGALLDSPAPLLL